MFFFASEVWVFSSSLGPSLGVMSRNDQLTVFPDRSSHIYIAKQYPPKPTLIIEEDPIPNPLKAPGLTSPTVEPESTYLLTRAVE